MDEKCADCGRFISPEEEWTEREIAYFSVTQEQWYPKLELICQNCSEGEPTGGYIRPKIARAIHDARCEGMERAAVIAKETYYNTSSQGQHRLAEEIDAAIRKEIADGGHER